MTIDDVISQERHSRDVSIGRAVYAANQEWKELAMRAIHSIAKGGVDFTADDVYDSMARYPHITTKEGRAIGGMMKNAQKLGWCEPTSQFIVGRRKNCHAMPRRVWRSLL